MSTMQCLRKDLEAGAEKYVIVKFWGVLFFKGDNMIRLLTSVCVYLLPKDIIILSLPLLG